jgi:hypothetical protein
MVFLTAGLALPGAAQEKHFSETGSGVLFSRSAFAHGYRHGYEEGYHVGNIDINMGRLARRTQSVLHGLKCGYSAGFGPRRSFEAGFEAGVKAGYGDGYTGRTFRAIEAVRAVASVLERAPLPADPASVYFDQGLALGYRDGFESGAGALFASMFRGPAPPAYAPPDLHSVSCGQFHPGREQDFAAQGSYCDGYRRGFILGQTDGQVLGAGHTALEASK